MPRLFYTVEDLHRDLQAGVTPSVSADTIVTAQAQDAASAAGVTIRSGGAAWMEPAPDRGPDAARAQTTLPHLPEPISDQDEATVIVTVAGRNRPGILAEVTPVLGSFQASVQDISQKMVEGFFHLMFVIELPPSADFATLKQTLECMGGDDYVVRVMHERVFRFMHRI